MLFIQHIYQLFPYTTLFRSPNIVFSPVGTSTYFICFFAGTFKFDSTLSLKAESNLKVPRSEEHTSELQSRGHLVCRLLLEKKNYTFKGINKCIKCES